jgi:amino acid transporter
MQVGLNKISYIISFSAVIATASVLLVFQMGQPRIWMSMSRDGLLPAKFSAITPRFKTPGFSTIITGIVVGVPSLFMNLTEVTDLTSIGTLFAFIIVCAGVLKLEPSQNGNFRVPAINGKYIVPALFILGILLFAFMKTDTFYSLFRYEGGWNVFKHKIPYLSFLVLGLIITVFTYLRNYSLIPVLGLLTNLYLMTELGVVNWMRFILWLIAGLIIYFSYSYKRSKLHQKIHPN